ncbi:hypothetical protein QWY20_17500 [Alkalimonas sp. MEB108]|uniref:Uncharacterized protein n=1 Tax=Alkalimonas cellulosilytica TaxID=3058395 RepID=A0ABU7J9N7_9GAMM|nr:hypothetical protein [Alkalimonas sp. MEB108]MEE2003251.1 hypothetical protein [Alkalimonas sp. MEB108]
MQNSTIFRILTTFIDVIPCVPNSISRSDIITALRSHGYEASDTQIWRDLNNYAPLFGVVSFFKDGRLYFQKSRLDKVSIPEMMLFRMSVESGYLDYLPETCHRYFQEKHEHINKQIQKLKLGVKEHSFFKWERNYTLVKKHEQAGVIDPKILKVLLKCLNDKKIMKCLIDGPEEVFDYFEPASLIEDNDALYVSGSSRRFKGEQYLYNVKSIKDATAEARESAYDLFLDEEQFNTSDEPPVKGPFN